MGCATSLTTKVSPRGVTSQAYTSTARLTKVTAFNEPQSSMGLSGITTSSSSKGIEKRLSNQTLRTLHEESVVDEFRNGPGQSFFKQFPTPSLLEEAQLAFVDCHYEMPDTTDSRKPQPYPVTSWRANVFKPEDYVELDRHAIELPSQCCFEPLEDLVDALLDPTTTSLEAVRVIFRWITAQDISHMTFSGSELPFSAAYYLYRIQQGRAGHAELFKKMCNLADVTCALIPGFVKGVGCGPGEDVIGHVGVWSAVFLDGCWRLVDCQWGSSHVSVADCRTPPVPSKGQSGTSEEMQITQHLSYSYEEFYFLTDPHHLIYSHFPYDERWQLLGRPLSLEEFQQIVYLKPSFFDLGFDIGNNPRCTLVAENGRCEISARLPSGGYRRFVYRLYRLESGSESKLKSVRLENYVFLEVLKDQREVKAKLRLPFVGKYKFKLFGRDTTKETNEFASLCSYVVYCDQTGTTAELEPDPKNPRYEWGLGAETDALGIEPVSHKSGYIHSSEGEVEIRLKVNQDIEFLHKLHRNGEEESTYKNYVFHRYESDQVVFRIRLPYKGKFMFSVFAKRLQDQGSFPNVCNYLIECDQPADEKSPFPAVYNSRVGPNDNLHKLKMTAVNGDSGFFVCNEAGELILRFNAEEQVWLIPKLSLQVGDGYKKMDEYAACRWEKGSVSVHLLFPEPGHYQFILYGKKSDSDTDGYPPIYYGLIQADFPKIGALPFPKVFSNWKDNFRLIEPQSGYLPTNESIRFLADIPESEGVAVIGSTWTHLRKNGSGLWEGTLETGDCECDLKFSACFTKGSRKYSCLQLFKVMPERRLKDLVEQQKEVFRQCQTRLKLKQAKINKLAKRKEKLSEGDIQEHNRETNNENSSEHRLKEDGEITSENEVMGNAADELVAERKVDRKTDANNSTVSRSPRNEFGMRETDFSPIPSKGQSAVTREMSAVNCSKESGEISSAGTSTLGNELLLSGRPPGSVTSSYRARDSASTRRSSTQRSIGQGSLDLAQLAENVQFSERQAAMLELTMATVQTSGNEAEKQKEIAEELRRKALNDKLKMAMKKQDRALLEATIKEFKAREIGHAQTELDDAQRLLDKLALKARIVAAAEAKDMQSLKRSIAFINEQGFAEELKDELKKGTEKLKLLERLSKFKSSILSMDANTMTEMRRYNNPPEIVHRVMAATLLLLGDHEGITKKWKNCQKRCNPTGPEGLKRRVLEFDVEKLHPEIAARAGQMLSEQDLDDVRVISSGAATFFVWAKGMVAEVAQRMMETGETVNPATKFRQKEIFLGRGDVADDDAERPVSRVSMMRPSTGRVRRSSITVQ